MLESLSPEKTGTEVSLALETVQAHIARFDVIGSGLAELEREHPKDLVLDVTSPAGMDQALESRRAWRTPRIALEKARQAAKKPVLDLGRKIDSFAGGIEEKLREGEDHYDAQIKFEEGRKESIRQAKLQLEAERVAGIRQRIREAFQVGPNPTGVRFTVAQLSEIRNRIVGAVVEDVGDLGLEVEETRKVTLVLLDAAITEQDEFETQQAQIRAEREALAIERRRDAAERLAQSEENARQQAQIALQRAELERREAEAREAERVRLKAEEQQDELARREREAQEHAATAARQRIERTAPAMLDCLRQWQAGEESVNMPEVDKARVWRDDLIERLRDVET